MVGSSKWKEAATYTTNNVFLHMRVQSIKHRYYVRGLLLENNHLLSSNRESTHFLSSFSPFPYRSTIVQSHCLFLEVYMTNTRTTRDCPKNPKLKSKHTITRPTQGKKKKKERKKPSRTYGDADSK